MSNTAMSDVKREIRRLTSGLEFRDYADFMEELAMWAADEAAMADYQPEAYGKEAEDEKEEE
jgi:hypothetical protein